MALKDRAELCHDATGDALARKRAARRDRNRNWLAERCVFCSTCVSTGVLYFIFYICI